MSGLLLPSESSPDDGGPGSPARRTSGRRRPFPSGSSPPRSLPGRRARRLGSYRFASDVGAADGVPRRGVTPRGPIDQVFHRPPPHLVVRERDGGESRPKVGSDELDRKSTRLNSSHANI